jgi:hypothetical protein
MNLSVGTFELEVELLGEKCQNFSFRRYSFAYFAFLLSLLPYCLACYSITLLL